MKSLVVLTTLSLLPMLVGCGASLPTEHDGEQFFRQEMTKREVPFNLVSFHKTNGKGEGQSYTIEFEAEIEFTVNCRWNDSGGWSFITGELADDPRMSVLRAAKKGQRQEVAGSIELEKTEKGWRGTRARFAEIVHTLGHDFR